MSWWQSVCNWRNPTRAWRADRSRQLVVDLDHFCLSGVGIGDSVEGLSFLGRGVHGSYGLAFPARGLLIFAEGDRITEIVVYFGHADERRLGSFDGTFLHRGMPLVLSTADTEESVISHFGEPFWRDQDENETILFYERDFEHETGEWQAEFGLDGHLKCLGIGWSLFAAAEQRAAYGVTKDWPPE